MESVITGFLSSVFGGRVIPNLWSWFGGAVATFFIVALCAHSSVLVVLSDVTTYLSMPTGVAQWLDGANKWFLAHSGFVVVIVTLLLATSLPMGTFMIEQLRETDDGNVFEVNTSTATAFIALAAWQETGFLFFPVIIPFVAAVVLVALVVRISWSNRKRFKWGMALVGGILRLIIQCVWVPIVLVLILCAPHRSDSVN